MPLFTGVFNSKHGAWNYHSQKKVFPLPTQSKWFYVFWKMKTSETSLVPSWLINLIGLFIPCLAGIQQANTCRSHSSLPGSLYAPSCLLNKWWVFLRRVVVAHILHADHPDWKSPSPDTVFTVTLVIICILLYAHRAGKCCVDRT